MARNILLVDDDPIVLKTLRKILEQEADQIVTALTLTEARAALRNNTITVAFCDLLLPDGSGLDFLRFSKQQTPPPEVIILTGGGSFDSVVEAIQLGACHYLEKPVTPSRVREVLNHGQERWEAAADEDLAQQQQGRALVLDDSHIELMVLNNLLTSLGYTAILTDTYDRAVAALSNNSFDIIISDVILQEKSGLDFLEYARVSQPEIPVIMVTASKGIEIAISALRGGAYDFLTKPINRELFEKSMLRARELSRARLARVRLERENERYRTRLEMLSEDLNRRVNDAVAEVSRLREFAEMILRSFPMAIVTTDTQLRITQANPAVLRYLGVSQDALVGRALGEIFGLRPFRDDLSEVCTRGVRISKQSATLDDLSLGRIMISYGCGPLKDAESGDIHGAILYFTDITGAQQLNDLEQDEQATALESMASSLAHEINNPLTVAVGMGQILESGFDLPPDATRLLSNLNQALDRVTTTLREKVEQARTTTRESRKVSVHACIEKVLDFYELKLLESKVSVTKEFLCEDPRTSTWGSEIEQVLINLIKNARDAMPRGGELLIRTSREDRWIKIEITDDGEGMPPEDIPRLMLPHVSTKPPGKGSGLGLSICQSIVRRHRGRLRITSTVSKGTTVEILLPVLDEIESSLEVLTSRPKFPNPFRVAVLDDEPEILTYCEAILSRAGITPQMYDAPEIALAALSESPVDVAILDVVMPGMNGLELCDRLLALHPGLQVVFMTGSARLWMKGESGTRPRSNIIWKPFREDDFLGALHEAAKRIEELG